MKNIIKRMLKIFGYELHPLYSLPLHNRLLKSFSYFNFIYPKIADIDGDIVECGVGKGRTLLYLCHLDLNEGKNRRIWGFDSFNGFPEPVDFDDSPRKPKKGDWSDTSIDLILGQLKRAGIDKNFVNDKVKLVKGFFPTTFKYYNGQPIAILHVDVDLYQSYKDVLDYFYPFVVKGGLIMFDEYNEPKWPGATKAIDEFISKTGHTLQKYPQTKKYYIIK